MQKPGATLVHRLRARCDAHVPLPRNLPHNRWEAALATDVVPAVSRSVLLNLARTANWSTMSDKHSPGILCADARRASPYSPRHAPPVATLRRLHPRTTPRSLPLPPARLPMVNCPAQAQKQHLAHGVLQVRDAESLSRQRFCLPKPCISRFP